MIPQNAARMPASGRQIQNENHGLQRLAHIEVGPGEPHVKPVEAGPLPVQRHQPVAQL